MKPARNAFATIGARITAVAIIPVVLALGVTLTTLAVQQRGLNRDVDATVRQRAFSETENFARSVYLLCDGAEKRNQQQLTRHLEIVNTLISESGGLQIGRETADWTAVNQLTQASSVITLPRVMLGQQWLGQIAEAGQAAPLVDEVQRRTGDFCTVFQRMNDAGDMLRVNTSVLKTDGSRAIGTFVAARNPDGSPNPVVSAVLRGETYRGRAFVVSEWHASAYEPIWDSAHQRVTGMLYVGIGMNAVNKELQDCIAQMVVGRTGSVWVLGSSGEERGRCLLSGQRDRIGKDMRGLKDAGGASIVDALLADAGAAKEGAIARRAFTLSASGRHPPVSFNAVTRFAPWSWIVVASADESDFSDVRENLEAALRGAVGMVAIAALVVAGVAAVAGVLVSRAIARPIREIIRELNASSQHITGAARQIATESQSLATGASQQAAAVEETSASLVELGGASERNAETSGQAASLAHAALDSADRGVREMQRMQDAMNALKTSSDGIAKIIKTIDEIAFQTNILALNAAVEAARAGEAGLGFAVVADEVRALAHRSAAAAKETAAGIEATIARSSEGARISGDVSSHLGTIVQSVREVNRLINEVATASREQRAAVQQITKSVDEMDHVVQRNAASSEEDAAAAEELTQQIGLLRVSVVDLAGMIGDDAAAPVDDPGRISPRTPPSPALSRKTPTPLPDANRTRLAQPAPLPS